MAARFKALVAGAAMFVASGCTIIHENPNAETPESPPPDQQAQPADTTATPASTAPAAAPGTESNPNLRTRLRVPARTPATRMVDKQNAQPQTNVGTLDVQVIDGSCQLSVDGQDFGMTNKVSTQVSAGEHQVDCKPQEGEAQTHKATVKANDTTHVIISLQAGQAADGQVPEEIQNKLKQ